MSKIVRYARHIIHEIVIFLVPKTLRKNMLSCEDVSRILSNEDSHAGHSKIKLKIHLLICQCCTDYSAQINIIKEKTNELSQIKLTSEQEEKIKASKQKLLNSIPKQD